MTPEVEKVLHWIGDNLFSVIAFIAIFIQITPIKWNPLTSLFKWIGKLITADTSKKLEEMSEQIEEMRDDIDENEKDRIRWEVLEFANSCRNNVKHSRDEFQHIITLNDKYRELLKKTGDKNGVFTTEYEWIHKIYEERLRKNDFLN